MIGVFSKNDRLGTALIDALTSLNAEKFKTGESYEAVLCLEPDMVELLSEKTKAPIIMLGRQHEEAALSLKTPIRLDMLRQRLNVFLSARATDITFETADFLFSAHKRQLTDKKNGREIALTEKESALIAYLVTCADHTATKEQLLEAVWNYRPDIETHTIESHVYALKQKIGIHADSLLQSTPEGYHLFI